MCTDYIMRYTVYVLWTWKIIRVKIVFFTQRRISIIAIVLGPKRTRDGSNIQYDYSVRRRIIIVSLSRRFLAKHDARP